MSAISKTIYVYDSFSNVEPQLMGRLYVELIRGRESYSIEYDKVNKYITWNRSSAGVADGLFVLWR